MCVSRALSNVKTEKLMHEIKESTTNRQSRYCMAGLMNLFLMMGIVFLAIQLLLVKMGLLSGYPILSVTISTGFLVIGFYFRKRISRIHSLGIDFICLISSGKKVCLHKNEILSVKKMVRFTISERAWYIIHFMNDRRKRERWLFQGEPGLGLVDRFKKMGVRLKNIP